jgi:hypothetical protein
MTQLKAVPEATPDPQLGAERRVSGVRFPYYNLDDSITAAKVIYERAGGSTDRAHLAEFLGYKGINNGSFVTRVTSAKLFGLIEQEADQLRVTERGRKIVAPIVPVDAQQAKVDAFLAVDLFRRVFETYNGQPLPQEIGLRRLIESPPYSVVAKQVTATVNVMMDSAEQAGFFAHGNRTKMLKPTVGASGAALPPTVHGGGASGAVLPIDPPAPRGGGGGGNGNGGGGSNIPAAIRGLLDGLPDAGTALPRRKREALVAAFTAAVAWIYPEVEEG